MSDVQGISRICHISHILPVVICVSQTQAEFIEKKL